jgi:hypothetical protein
MTFRSSAAVMALGIMLAAGPLPGQAPKGGYTPLKTPWGDPDL